MHTPGYFLLVGERGAQGRPLNRLPFFVSNSWEPVLVGFRAIRSSAKRQPKDQTSILAPYLFMQMISGARYQRVTTCWVSCLVSLGSPARESIRGFGAYKVSRRIHPECLCNEGGVTLYTSVDVLIGNDSGQTKIADFYREILMKIRKKIYIYI